jgi:hypothetical protein
MNGTETEPFTDAFGNFLFSILIFLLITYAFSIRLILISFMIIIFRKDL